MANDLTNYVAKVTNLGAPGQNEGFAMFDLDPRTLNPGYFEGNKNLEGLASEYIIKVKYIVDKHRKACERRDKDYQTFEAERKNWDPNDIYNDDFNWGNLSYNPPIDLICRDDGVYKVIKLSEDEIKAFEDIVSKSFVNSKFFKGR